MSMKKFLELKVFIYNKNKINEEIPMDSFFKEKKQKSYYLSKCI